MPLDSVVPKKNPSFPGGNNGLQVCGFGWWFGPRRGAGPAAGGGESSPGPFGSSDGAKEAPRPREAGVPGGPRSLGPTGVDSASVRLIPTGRGRGLGSNPFDQPVAAAWVFLTPGARRMVFASAQARTCSVVQSRCPPWVADLGALSRLAPIGRSLSARPFSLSIRSRSTGRRPWRASREVRAGSGRPDAGLTCRETGSAASAARPGLFLSARPWAPRRAGAALGAQRPDRP